MMQKQLQEKAYGYSFDTLTPEKRVELIKEMSIHATQEIHEMLYELPFFKPWKDYSNMNRFEVSDAMDKAREEFIDFWHFAMNMGLLLGLDSDQWFEMYYAKNKENYERQEKGYTHDKSFRSNTNNK